MLSEEIFNIVTESQFEENAIAIFQYQYQNIAVYRQFCDFLNANPSKIKKLQDIPFLPISAFKTHKILPTNSNSEIVFTSSGTTGSLTSKHFVADLSIYIESFQKSFKYFYGNIEDYTVLALLPSYLERNGSSLIYMAENFIQKSQKPNSGFYLDDFEKLSQTLSLLEKKNEKTLLIGVSFALLDLVEKENFNLKNTIIMETGGMKGRRKELIREELHQVLKAGFSVDKIHSEYGMTELLSQAYSKGNGLFNCPPWMRVLTRDTEDALSYIEGKTGGLNIVDLANINSCSFIATQDLGKVYNDGSFEIMGRFDESDIRGCNLMVL